MKNKQIYEIITFGSDFDNKEMVRIFLSIKKRINPPPFNRILIE